MSTPSWILAIFGAIMILIAEASAAQLLLARAWTRPGRPGADLAVAQLLTGIALAGVLVPGLAALPSAVWEIVFAVLTAWFAWSLWPEIRGQATYPARATTPARTTALARLTALARAPHAPYLLSCAAMLYIFAALATSPAASSAVPTPDVSSSPAAGMAGMPGMTAPAAISSAATAPPHVTTLALLLAVLLVASLVYVLDQPARRPATAPAAYPAALLLLSPTATKACQVTLALTMALILIIR